MADKSIGELVAASAVGSTDLFVLEQNSVAKKLSGQILENWLVSFADGHGGIQTVAKTATSGLVDTYTITYADTSTSTFTVTNGAKGDTGAASYVYVRYSHTQPDSDSDIGTVPDDWIGIAVTTSSTAPTAYTSYAWYNIKGAKGDTGDSMTILSQAVTYQASDSGTVIPLGTWLDSVPSVAQGRFLWTRTVVNYADNTSTTAYSVGRMGIDGTGTVSSVNNIYPDANGNVELEKPTVFTVTLTAAGWSNKAQTVSNALFVSSGFAYTVSPDDASFTAYGNAAVRAKAITSNGSCTFVCETAPNNSLTVNIMRTGVGA